MSYPEAAYSSDPPPASRFPLVNALLLAVTIPCMAAAGAGWEGFDPISHPSEIPPVQPNVNTP